MWGLGVGYCCHPCLYSHSSVVEPVAPYLLTVLQTEDLWRPRRLTTSTYWSQLRPFEIKKTGNNSTIEKNHNFERFFLDIHKRNGVPRFQSSRLKVVAINVVDIQTYNHTYKYIAQLDYVLAFQLSIIILNLSFILSQHPYLITYLALDSVPKVNTCTHMLWKVEIMKELSGLFFLLTITCMTRIVNCLLWRVWNCCNIYQF